MNTAGRWSPTDLQFGTSERRNASKVPFIGRSCIPFVTRESCIAVTEADQGGQKNVQLPVHCRPYSSVFLRRNLTATSAHCAGVHIGRLRTRLV